MSRRKIRLFPVLLGMMALLFGSCISVYAVPTAASLDLERTGSISIDFHKNESEVVVTDGSLLYYQVAGVGLNDGRMVYRYTSDFSACDPDYLEDLMNKTTVSYLEDYVNSYGIAGMSGRIVDGRIAIGDLPLGAYLIVQTGEDDFAFSPFLATIPLADGDDWRYDVSAETKVEPLALPTQTPIPSAAPQETPIPTNPADGYPGGETRAGPGSGGVGTPSSGSTISTLPQTGQLFWPIVLLTGGGAVLLLVGFFRRRPDRFS